jgi:glycosyltransferase involved in cell wall biosynthesis
MPDKKEIAYFAVLHDGPNSGAGKKVLAQANLWRNSEVKTKIYVISSEEYLNEWKRFPDVVAIKESKGLKRLTLRRNLIREIFSSGPSAVYVRDGFPFVFPKIPKGVSVILEVQTLMRQELLSRNRVRAAQSWLLDTFYLRRFTKFIFVSNEIAASKRFTNYKSYENSTVISNGVKLDEITEIKTLPRANPAEFVFLGQNGQPWHGVEQILELARSMPCYLFNVVGVTDKFSNVPSNAIFHGVLTQSEYFPIAEKCVLGIGTLNLNAKGMTEGSSLKVREYLAMGLPVFFRHTDTDFVQPPSFILELPNDDKPITSYIDQIISFAETWANQRVPRTHIRGIDMKEKESARLKFIFSDSSSS